MFVREKKSHSLPLDLSALLGPAMLTRDQLRCVISASGMVQIIFLSGPGVATFQWHRRWAGEGDHRISGTKWSSLRRFEQNETSTHPPAEIKAGAKALECLGAQVDRGANHSCASCQ